MLEVFSDTLTSEIFDFIDPLRGHVDYLSCTAEGDQRCSERILKDWNSIKALRIRTEIPPEKSFYSSDKINLAVTRLVLVSKMHVAALLGVFKIFPNLRNLTIAAQGLTDQGVSQTDIKHLQEKFKSLKKFWVAIQAKNSNLVEIKVLRHITALLVFQINEEFDWTILKEAGSNVKRIHIRDKVPSNLEKVLEVLPNLESLHVENTNFDRNLLGTLAKRKNKLKSLVLRSASSAHVKDLNEEILVLGIEGLVVKNLSADSNFFNEGCYKTNDSNSLEVKLDF